MTISKEELASEIAKAIRKEFGGASGTVKFPYAERATTEGFLKPKGKKYAEMFSEDTFGSSEWSSFNEFLQAAYEGRDPKLKDLSVGDSDAGGYTVPTEYAAMMLDTSLESEIIRPRCQVWSMSSNTRKIPAFEIGSHESHVLGGISGGFVGEGGTMTANEPDFRQIELRAQKLYTYAVSTREIYEDGANFEQTLGKALTLGLGWYLDYYCIQGDGAGKPLGILANPCVISQTKETGQGSDTVLIENVTGMMSKLHAPCWKNGLWLGHPTLYPQLATLSLAIGTGGSATPALKKSGKDFTLMDMPLILTEKMPTLSSAGDLLLFDPTQFAMGIRKGLRLEQSNAPNFTTDKIDMRCILRVDFQGLWDEALTLKDGSSQTSCAVKLGAR